MTRPHCKFSLALLVVCVLGLASARPSTAEERAGTKARIAAALQHVPLHFEANRGQTDRRVQFLARGSGYSLFLTPKEAVLVLRKTEGRKGSVGVWECGSVGMKHPHTPTLFFG